MLSSSADVGSFCLHMFFHAKIKPKRAFIFKIFDLSAAIFVETHLECRVVCIDKLA